MQSIYLLNISTFILQVLILTLQSFHRLKEILGILYKISVSIRTGLPVNIQLLTNAFSLVHPCKQWTVSFKFTGQSIRSSYNECEVHSIVQTRVGLDFVTIQNRVLKLNFNFHQSV